MNRLFCRVGEGGLNVGDGPSADFDEDATLICRTPEGVCYLCPKLAI
ncbi:MAG: hypothetical protein AAF549_06090 [Pseudomonadota bacterium]